MDSSVLLQMCLLTVALSNRLVSPSYTFTGEQFPASYVIFTHIEEAGSCKVDLYCIKVKSENQEQGQFTIVSRALFVRKNTPLKKHG